VRKIHVDKGDRVGAGQVLVELESPELDQQVANARANYELQTATNRRNQELVCAVEVTSGVAPDDMTALNVGQAVRDGETVQPVLAEEK